MDIKQRAFCKRNSQIIRKKLEKIPDEEIVTPPNYVFVPALQAISVSIDNEVLRDMYANLLAKSVYAKTSAQAHPAHVDIIRQMDPIDAIIFKSFSEHQFSLPIKEFSIVNKSNDLVLHSNVYLTDYDLYDVHTISVSLDNLIRLGLLLKWIINYLTNLFMIILIKILKSLNSVIRK